MTYTSGRPAPTEAYEIAAPSASSTVPSRCSTTAFSPSRRRVGSAFRGRAPSGERRVGPGSGGEVERAREAAEELAGPPQHLDHPGRDRTVGGQLAGQDPADAGAGGGGAADRAVPPGEVAGGAVDRDEELGGIEPGCVGGGGQVRGDLGLEGAAQGHRHRVGGED